MGDLPIFINTSAFNIPWVSLVGYTGMKELSGYFIFAIDVLAS